MPRRGLAERRPGSSWGGTAPVGPTVRRRCRRVRGLAAMRAAFPGPVPGVGMAVRGGHRRMPGWVARANLGLRIAAERCDDEPSFRGEKGSGCCPPAREMVVAKPVRPGPDRAKRGLVCARRRHARRCRLAPARRQAASARQHQPAARAALLALVEPGRKRLAVPPPEPPRQSHPPNRRGCHRCPLQRRPIVVFGCRGKSPRLSRTPPPAA